MNMVSVLDADKYYGVLDYLVDMRDEYRKIADTTTNPQAYQHCASVSITLGLVYKWLAESEVTSDDV